MVETHSTAILIIASIVGALDLLGIAVCTIEDSE